MSSVIPQSRAFPSFSDDHHWLPAGRRDLRGVRLRTRARATRWRPRRRAGRSRSGSRRRWDGTSRSPSKRPEVFKPTSRPTWRRKRPGRVIATPVDVGQSVQQGSVLVRIQGVDANLRLDESRANAQRAEAAVKLAESQHQLALTTDAALSVAAGNRRRLPDRGRSGENGSGNEPPERQHHARVAGAGPGAARAGRKGGDRRRGRSRRFPA